MFYRQARPTSAKERWFLHRSLPKRALRHCISYGLQYINHGSIYWVPEHTWGWASQHKISSQPLQVVCRTVPPPETWSAPASKLDGQTHVRARPLDFTGRTGKRDPARLLFRTWALYNLSLSVQQSHSYTTGPEIQTSRPIRVFLKWIFSSCLNRRITQMEHRLRKVFLYFNNLVSVILPMLKSLT